MASVREINDLEGLESCRLAWNALFPQTRRASFFQTWDWLAAYWRHYGEDRGGQNQRLRVLVVQSAGKTVGILPLVELDETTKLGRVKVLTYPLHDWGTFYGPIGPNPTATLIAGLGHVRRQRYAGDLIDFRWVDAEVDHGRTVAAMRAQGMLSVTDTWSTAAEIRLEGTWEHYWAARTSRWRNNVRRSEKKLAERGEIEYVRYRPRGTMSGEDDPRWDLYDACESLAATSWQGNSTTGTTLSHNTVRDFLRDAHQVATACGMADINLLLLNGRPVAFNYAYQYGGYVFGLRTGMTADPEADGAGTVLQRRMIEDCYSRGDTVYDLGAEYVECKRYWTTHYRPGYRHTYFAPSSPRSQLLRLKRWWKRTSGKAAKV
jgi:CelD/BcsL family acetyltransferase involved in cellulose biosynthesis